jgi:hypothetical protein
VSEFKRDIASITVIKNHDPVFFSIMKNASVSFFFLSQTDQSQSVELRAPTLSEHFTPIDTTSLLLAPLQSSPFGACHLMERVQAVSLLFAAGAGHAPRHLPPEGPIERHRQTDTPRSALTMGYVVN